MLSVHTRARLPFDLRRHRSGGIQTCSSVRVHGFENLLDMCIVRSCDRRHTFLTRIDLLQLAAEFLSMPNDWLRREFKALFSVRQAIVSYLRLNYLSALSSHKRLSRPGSLQTAYLPLHELLLGKLPVFGQCRTQSPIPCVVAGWAGARSREHSQRSRTFIRSHWPGARRRSLGQPRVLFGFQARPGAILLFSFVVRLV